MRRGYVPEANRPCSTRTISLIHMQRNVIPQAGSAVRVLTLSGKHGTCGLTDTDRRAKAWQFNVCLFKSPCLRWTDDIGLPTVWRLLPLPAIQEKARQGFGILSGGSFLGQRWIV